MKILLIEPAKAPVTLGGDDVFMFEPLALEYVAAGVAKNHDVRILDLRLEKNLQQVLEEFSPDVVGITAYTVHVNTVIGLFDRIKMWNPEVLTVVGGHHATVVPEDFVSPSIDVIVRGEGVFPFREIVLRHEARRGFDNIPGVMTQGADLRGEGFPMTVDLDGMPFPERVLTAKYREHYYSEWMKPLASIRTSKGCPYRCNFCALWKVAGGKYFRRTPESVVEELAGIEEEFVFFADDESLIDVVRMEALARLIKAAGIRKRYFLYGRSDTIAKHPRLLELWRDVGLARIFVGLEFFRDEDLKYIRKNSTTQDNAKAMRVVQDLGIEVYASLIIRPEFTKEDFEALIEYCHTLGLSYASFAVLTPLPGTDLYNEVESRMITHNYDYFDFIHTLLPTELPLRDFYREYARLFRRAVPPSKAIPFLLQYPWKEIPPTLAKSYRWQQRLRSVHLDYGQAGLPGSEKTLRQTLC
ncbi:MAG: B12-binding domain-containing radical SAM protein [Ignavibacteria bacterium]|nr:B12-binding domain-containing radical SAM protein [Ignavibacteria bacterium]